MNNFKFRYNSLLNYLENKEEKIKEQLREANQKLNNEKDKLNLLEMENLNCNQLIESKLDSGCKLNYLKSIDIYKRELIAKMKFQKNKIEKLEKSVYLIKKDLIKASKEKKIMEKLKEKKFEKFKYDLKIAEEKIVDQIVTYSNNMRR